MSLLILWEFATNNLVCIFMSFLNFDMSRKGKIGNKSANVPIL